MVHKTEPTGWEHRIEQVTVTDRWGTRRQLDAVRGLRERLDELGRYGWELVDFSTSSHRIPDGPATAEAVTHVAVLKRATGRTPVPEPATSRLAVPATAKNKTCFSTGTRDAILTRWDQACGPAPDAVRDLLNSQSFLPDDDWSLMVPCGMATGLLAVGCSWWMIVRAAEDPALLLIGDLATLAAVEQHSHSLILRDTDRGEEIVELESPNVAERTAAFIRARRQALYPGRD